MNATLLTFFAPALPRKDPPKSAVGLRFDEEGIATVTFDRPGSSANVLDSATLRLFSRILDQLAAEKSLRGVVVKSAKPGIFIAGADLKELAAASDPAELIELGQDTFAKLAALPGVTVAAIHGACMGGGLELALACDFRLASSDRATRLGLPEVNLGLIPAWGGSTRLPRLVGLPNALQVILSAEVLPAARAKELGVVDGLAPRERLPDLARRWIEKGKPPPRPPRKIFSVVKGMVAARWARRLVRKKTRGHYPAPLEAIEVVAKSLSRTVPQSLAAERSAVLKLAGTETCRNLIRAFTLQDHARHLVAPRALPVGKIAVIGAGVMGAGIAQWLASRGRDVLLRDVDAAQVARGLQRAGNLFSDAVRRKVMSAAEARAGMDRLAAADRPVPLKFVDLVIEAAAEKMEVKRQIFAGIGEQTRPDTILATNTSALSIAAIGSALRNPQRLVGLHFFNPVHRMRLVEVVRSDATSPIAIDTAVAFVQRIGKLPVVVRDRPGFLVNRILMPYLLEAALLFANGAEIEELDRSMLDFGMPMGPLRLLDEVGLDVAADVARTLAAAFPSRLSLPAAFNRLLEAGMTGRKSGRGFYEYGKGRNARANPAVRKFSESRSAAELTREELRQRMVLLMINEAARCLEEDIVEGPADVDFAMIMGTGFAPFRGGPLRHADAIGIGKITGTLRELEAKGGGRFAPCARLREMDARQQRFYED